MLNCCIVIFTGVRKANWFDFTMVSVSQIV